MRLFVLAGILVITACAGCAARTTPDGKKLPGLPSGVSRFIDHEAQVVCWQSATGYGIGLSCLPLAEIALDDGQE